MIPAAARPDTLVLNVDDDDLTRYAITQILRRGGYRVIEAPTVADADRLVEAEEFELVVLDINLPDGNGIDVCRRLKANPRTSLIPVLQVSATSIAIEDQVAGLEGGADAYLTWPVDPHVLLATARALLRAREAEAAVSLMGRQWQATVDAARDGMAILDETGRVVRANRRLGELVGQPVSRLPGQHLPTLLDPDGRTGLGARVRAALASGEADRFEIELPGGVHRASLDRVDDGPGGVRGVVLVLTDIGELRRLIESERETRITLTAVVAQMPVGLLVADQGGAVVLHNRHLEAIAGRSFEGASLVDQGTWAGVSFEGQPLEPDTSPFLRALRAGERFDDRELEIELPDGIRTLHFSAAPIEVDGRITAMVAAFSDISERKALDAIRDTFIGVLSHELRTPVTTILGGSRLLDSPRRNLDPETRAELTRDITAEAERLHRLVEDLLVLARTERGVPMQAADPVLVQHVIPSVIASELRLWPGLRVESRIGTLPAARGDAAYLEQVVRNLLSNAAKYGGAAGPVDVEASADRDEIRILVRDRGPGVSDADAPHLFDLFYRARAAQRHVSGAGIGLFVCRQLVHAMGGRIWVAPASGGGTEFGFTLPVFAEGPIDHDPIAPAAAAEARAGG